MDFDDTASYSSTVSASVTLLLIDAFSAIGSYTERFTTPGRPDTGPVLQKVGLGKARVALDAAGQNAGRRFVFGDGIGFAVDGSAAQDDWVTVGTEAQQVWGEAGVLGGEEPDQPGAGDNDVLVADGPKIRLRDRLLGTGARTVDDHRGRDGVPSEARSRRSAVPPGGSSRRKR
ncbi:hypothetical protein [Streptomyces nitrosporeus]|uniref:hypothetical protein n=1 Tax=Streptomyces nitrosporeus TaxID=28894 RepID=UPI003CC73F46